MRPASISRVPLLEGVIVKPLHSAAYLLVGWYLMVPPPLSHDGRMHRLSDWAIRGVFGTEKDCDAKLAKFPKTEPSLASYPDGLPPEETYEVQCVASDDPRLKVVSWHLMMPHRPGDPSEPLSQWYRSDSDDTEAGWSASLEWERSLYLGKQGQDSVVQEQIRRLRYSQCVADNDPRLAKGHRFTFAP
jgi:hypothetical protein